MQTKNVPTQEEWESGLWTPAPYRVVCRITPTAKNHISRPMLTGVGAAHTLEEAQQLIVDDRAAMGDTFGGLIEALGTSGRDYRIFRAAGWEDVTPA